MALTGLSSTAPVAFSNAGRGKGDSCWLAHYDDVVQATHKAGEALSLRINNKQIEKNKAFFKFIDQMEKEMDVLIERRTETMTYARFDVGLFGSKAMGRLMVRQIVFEMAKAGAFLRGWHPSEDN
jgi:hypothetical protein